MADGKIRITLEARQAIQLAEELSGQLQNVDKAASGANRATDKLGNSSNKAAVNHRKLVESVVSINNRVRQLATISTATNTTLAQLNSTVNRLALDYRNTTASVQGLVSSLNGLNAAQNTTAQGATNASSSVAQMGSQMSATTSIARGLQSILMTFGTAFSLQYAVHTLMEFDHAMTQVQAISRATGTALDDLRSRAKELGATTIYTSGEAASAMKFLAQSGFDVNEILAASGPVLALAQAGDLGLAQAAEIAAKALRGFRLDATEMSDVADVMAAAVTQSTMNITELGYAFKYVAPIAASMGVSIREASAYIGTLSDAGIDATMAGTALRRIMSELSNPTIKATKLLAAHGLTMSDVDIQTKGLTETIKTLIKAGLSVGEVFALFGDRGAPAFQTLAQQIEKVEKKVADLQNVTGRALEMQRVMNQSLYAAFKNLTSALEFFVIQLSEETGLLNSMKVALFGTAEGVRYLARNMDVVAPIIAGLAATKIPSLIAALGKLSVVASTGTALKKFFDISSHVNKASAALKVLSTEFVTARKTGTLASATIYRAMTGVNAVVGTTLKGLWSLTGLLGGPLNTALAIAAGATLYFSMRQTEAEKAGEMFEELLDAQAHGADAYTKALDQLKNSVKSLDLQHATKKFDEAQRSMEGLREELLDTADSADSLYNRFKRLYESDESSVTYDKTIDSVKALVSAYEKGGMTAEEMKTHLESLLGGLNDTDTGSKDLIVTMLDIVTKMNVAANAADVYAARIALLTHKTERCTEAQKKLIDEIRKASLLQDQQIIDMLQDTYKDEFLAEVYERGRDMNKKDFDIYLRANKEAFEKLGSEATKYYRVVKSAADDYVVVLKTEKEMGEQNFKEFQKRMPLQESEIKMANDRLAALNKLRKAQQERTEKDKEETKSTKEKTNTANKYASAVNKVNEDMAKLLMTDREFQQFKFEQELAKLRKTLGATNPEFQRLVTLWEQAKDLGLSSPKEIMKARSSFEEWQQVQEHGGDINWNKKALIEVQARYLEDFYKDDAKKSIEIKRWAEDEKRKITSGSLQKDTQALLQFWQDYINIACAGEDQYSALLEQYYQERFAAYLALCNNEVAARKKAEDDKLRASRNAIDGIRVATRDWINENSNMAKQMGDIVTKVYDGIADALTDMVLTGKANWEDLGRTVLNELTKMIIKSMILANLMKLMGMIGSAVGGWFSSGSGTVASGAINAATSFGSAFIGAARGGVFSGGNISDYSGSVMNAPTAFNYSKEMTQFARGGAVMGEAGWEGVLPLGRNSRGELGVKADVGGDGGFGGTQDVIVNIYNYSNEDVKQESGIDSNGNKTIDVWVGDMAADQAQKPGSNMNRAIRGVTGMKPQVTRR